MRCSFCVNRGRNPTLCPSFQLGWSTSGTTTVDCDIRFVLFAGTTPHCIRHFNSGDLLVMLRTIDVPMVQRAGRSDTFEAVRVVWEFRAGEKGLQFFQVGGSKRFLAGVG